MADPELERQVREALRIALVNIAAEPAPAGVMDVVLGPGWPGILLHEAIGHGLEGDFNRKSTLAEFGFRLPSCRDNRPLKFAEFAARVGQPIFLSAPPGQNLPIIPTRRWFPISVLYAMRSTSHS